LVIKKAAHENIVLLPGRRRAMNTKESSKEQISALADGELDDPTLETALAFLRESEGANDWELYHQIGDALRSDDMAISMSPMFATRVMDRLEADPNFVVPDNHSRSALSLHEKDLIRASSNTKSARQSIGKRWGLPGVAAAAAIAAVGLVCAPQLMVAMKSTTGGSSHAVVQIASLDASGSSMSNAAGSVSRMEQRPDGVILRDPQIDDYLLAHQRFSPSIYSTAQYARTATFATDSSK